MLFYQSIILLCSWLSEGCLNQQAPLDFDSRSVYHPSTAFEEKVNWALEQFKVPGLAISFINGSRVFTKGYGVADLTTSQPVSEHTLFFGGSTTKAFTAALISILVDDNENFPEIQWDATVHSIIPDDFTLSDPWFTTQVTVEDMLSHRSGMPRHDWVWFANMTLQEAVRKMRYLPLTSTIRTKFNYCNLMYMAAAHLIETKTGQLFKDVLRERILEPLGMTETYVSLSDAQAAGGAIARGYFLNSTEQLQDTDLSFHESIRGAGNIITSAADYAKWVQAMIQRSPPISPAGYAAIMGGHTIISPEPMAPDTSPTLYGFGWFLRTYAGEVIIQHPGGIEGFGSLVCFLPRKRIGFVILGNNMIGTNAAVTLLGNHLIDDILGIQERYRPNWRKRAEATLENTKISPRVLDDLYPRIPSPPLPPPLKLSEYEGTYTHPAYPTLKITTDCPSHSLFPKLSGKRKLGPYRLCAKPLHSAFGSSALVLELIHVTGDFWVVGTLMYGATSATRGKFVLSPEGAINQISIEMEPTMALEHKGIHWKKTT
ncbi:Beta-lactamase class C family protein [Trichophyton interdigitale]|uniref:Beta-lactamase class C family protein n=1 Tax=Trichophyton interdigitale TaxID=101480 RepID=A0A9P4YLD8_9EURO|nr:Beta-lactamase class C family protein [Trichophyton interdigitale]KAF3900774.1 Beta-lactamase class C family protein [Trichophyton interdigitale]KAG8211726.1 Beta-lactamase class C family protein [Trichophyton interdigitale]